MKKTLRNITVIILSIFTLFCLSNYSFKKGYETGLEDGFNSGGTQCVKLIAQSARRAAKDTTEVACLDFYVNKDTFHVPMWNKAIKMNNKDLK